MEEKDKAEGAANAARSLADEQCPIDCGDNSCACAGPKRGGMRTNGGCRCDALALRRAVQWWRQRAAGNAGASPPPDSASESLREARRLLGEAADGLRGLLCLPHPPDRDSRRVVEIAGDTLAAVDTFLEERSDREQSSPPE